MSLRKFIQGKNKIGQVFYGIVDSLPVPNLLNPLRAAIDEKPLSSKADIISHAAKKVDKTRLIVSALTAYLVISGKLTLENANAVLEMIKSFI
jgi:hypothetical protein